MRKKTIKYYFFNSIVRNPAVHYVFCLSKRGFKQNKQRVKTKKLKNKKEIIYYMKDYKRKIHIRLKLNQWNKNNNKIISFFLKSYYNRLKYRSLILKKKKINKELKFWFFFKNRFFKKLLHKLKKFPKIGMLSSHFVHFISLKNLEYHILSKYKPKIVTLNFYNNYIYTYSKFIYVYLFNINSFLYFFSSNDMNKSIWLDNDFYINTSFWYTNTLNYKKNLFINITNRSKNYLLKNFTTENYTNSDIIELYSNKDLVKCFFIEEDPKKKEETYKKLLETVQPNILAYIHTINFFITPTFFDIYTKNLKQHLNMYVYIYKLYLVNNNDISARKSNNTVKTI